MESRGEGQGIDVVSRWRGLDVVGTDGEKVGQITEIYLDDRDDQPRWALVEGSAQSVERTRMPGDPTGNLVPIGEAYERDQTVCVPYDSTVVATAPGMAPAGGLSEEEEAELHRHYGLAYLPRPLELDDDPVRVVSELPRNGAHA
jgi:sporulation protein YlmC with PRC-barrel domain